MGKYLSLLVAFIVYIYIFSLSANAVASQAGKAYRAADERLNRVYQELVSKMKNPSDRQRLKTAEQVWIKLRDADVNFYGKYYVNSKGGLFLGTKLTIDRADYLQAILKELPQQDGNDTGPISADF
jgi:uncharacterized protein YecT (DUF1311 family)